MYGYSIAEWEMIQGQKQRAEQQAQMLQASSASASIYQELQREEQEYSNLYFDERNETDFKAYGQDDLWYHLLCCFCVMLASSPWIGIFLYYLL